eukprot:403358369
MQQSNINKPKYSANQKQGINSDLNLKQNQIEIHDKKGYQRRGDGLADFLELKSMFKRIQADQESSEKRLRSLEDYFHKQSILTNSNEIVTNQSLQNYLDTLTSHLNAQFQQKLNDQNALINQKLASFKEELDLQLKEKASKYTSQRQYADLLEKCLVNESKLNQILTDQYYESIIEKKMQRKAEQSDVEQLERNKADISAVKECMEKLQRLQMIVDEGMYVGEGEEDEDEDATMYDDEEIDPEELKDQVNNSEKLLLNHERSIHSFHQNSSGVGQHGNYSKFNKSALEHTNNIKFANTSRNSMTIAGVKEGGGSDFSRDENGNIHLDHSNLNNGEATNKSDEAKLDQNKIETSGIKLSNLKIDQPNSIDVNNMINIDLTNNKAGKLQSINTPMFENNHHMYQTHLSPKVTTTSTFKNILGFQNADFGLVQSNVTKNMVSSITPRDSSKKGNQEANLNLHHSSKISPILSQKIPEFHPSPRKDSSNPNTNNNQSDEQQILPSIGVKINIGGKQKQHESSSNYDNQDLMINISNNGGNGAAGGSIGGGFPGNGGGHTGAMRDRDRTPVNGANMMINDFMSNASSMRRTSKWSSPRRRGLHGLKRGISVNMSSQMNTDLDNLKKENFLFSQKLKELQEQIKLTQTEVKPSTTFHAQNEDQILKVLRQYNLMALKINEQETYDDKLKKKYLKSSIKEMNKIKLQLEKESKQLRDKQDQDKDYTRVKLKSLEVEFQSLKSSQDLIRKMLQQNKIDPNSQQFQNQLFLTQQDLQNNPTSSARSQNYTPLLTNSVYPNPLQSSVISHQSVTQNHLYQLQSDQDNLKNFVMQQIQQVLTKLGELQTPMLDQVQNLKRENESFIRELDRYDALYRNMLNDYINVLEENKSYVLKQQELEKTLNLNRGTIQNTTIQYFTQGAPLIHQTKLCSLMDSGHYDPKNFKYSQDQSNQDYINQQHKLDQITTKMIDTKRKLKLAFDQDMKESSIDQSQMVQQKSFMQHKASRTTQNSPVNAKNQASLSEQSVIKLKVMKDQYRAQTSTALPDTIMEKTRDKSSKIIANENNIKQSSQTSHAIQRRRNIMNQSVLSAGGDSQSTRMKSIDIYKQMVGKQLYNPVPISPSNTSQLYNTRENVNNSTLNISKALMNKSPKSLNQIQKGKHLKLKHIHDISFKKPENLNLQTPISLSTQNSPIRTFSKPNESNKNKVIHSPFSSAKMDGLNSAHDSQNIKQILHENQIGNAVVHGKTNQVKLHLKRFNHIQQ